MMITPANLQFFFTNLQTNFWTAYSNAPTISDKIATTYPVTSERWVSAWMGMLDKMRQWKGSRITRQPAPQTYMVEIQPYELTEQVDQFKLEDDTYGVYFPTVQMMGENIKKWPDYSIRDMLLNQGDFTGGPQLGLDGLTHWNTAHPVDPYDASKGTYTNDYRGGISIGGVTVGGALGVNSFATVWEDIAGRRSENGEALGILPGMTLAPPQLKITLDTILQAQFFAPATIGNLTGNVGSTENMLKGWTDRLIWPDLAAAPTTWFMLVADKPVKPFSWLLRQAPNFVYRTNPQDPVVFDTHTYLYGSMSRGAPAWGFPWLSAISGP